MAKITVIGLGYIGLPTAIVLAMNGHDVYGYDVNIEAINKLKKGEIHIVEKDLQSRYDKVFKSKKLIVGNEFQQSSIYIIAVPTPLLHNVTNDEKTADLSFVFSATSNLAKHIKKGDLVILESTVPPKTTRKITDIIVSECSLERNDFHVVHCPERVLPGKILYELENNDRIIGSERTESALIAKELYKTFVKNGNIFITTDITAELAKLVENSYRDINISFANELSIISDNLGVDVFELISLANKHPRVNILNPGVGVGGHCLAVDPWFIVEQFPKEALLIKTAREINDYKPFWLAEKIIKEIDYDRSKKILILGLSYKADIDDLRESPSIKLAEFLQTKGYKVEAVEPNTKLEVINEIKVVGFDDGISTSDLTVLTIPHKEFIKRVDDIRKTHFFDCIGMI